MKQYYGGEVNVTWKCFPLEQLKSRTKPDWKLWEQPESYPSQGLLALRAGEAARNQGEQAFQQFHLALLNAYHIERKSIDQAGVLLDVARATGLDLEKFHRDLEDRSYLKKIGCDYTEGREKYAVFGTPTIIASNGNAAFLKMMPPPSPENAVQVFDTLFGIISRMPFVGEIKRPEPSFEDSAYHFLIIHGYRVQRRVEYGGSRVDLAVEDPDSPGDYLLGILCDTSTSAQDSDHRAILQDRAMRLYRLSSADWERERGPTEDKLLDALRGQG